MRERKLTRHDIGREKFVSEVSSNSLPLSLSLSLSHTHTHTHTFILMFPLYCVERSGIGKTSTVAPFYSNYVVWVPL